jgi:aminoglycoside phosphotransferase (APT) family kinase protein
MDKNSYQEDVIDVREDERIDVLKVEDFMRGKLPGTDRPLSIRQFGGGAANLTYLLDYGTHEYVLRRGPLGPVAATAHDMQREYRVLSVLYEVFPKAPRAYLYSDDPGVAGAPFLVMERKRGVVVRREIPEIFAGEGGSARKMSEALVDSLAEFHAVDYDAIGLGELGKPEGFITRQIEGWYKRWGFAKHEEVPAMDHTYTWLKENQPEHQAFSLVHNDYKLDNAILSPEDPGEIVAILDWDMCTLGDPLSDVGALVGYWTEPGDPPYAQMMAMMPTGDMGFLSRTELVQRYTEKSGRSVEHINFYFALSLFRITVIVAQIYIRYLRGQTQDERFAMFEQAIPIFARAAEDVAEGRMGVEV